LPLALATGTTQEGNTIHVYLQAQVGVLGARLQVREQSEALLAADLSTEMQASGKEEAK
jgi:hypothetical protein